MRVVDAGKQKSPSSFYIKISQPMYVYHTTDEFKNNVDQDNVTLVTNFGEYGNLCIKLDVDTNYNPNGRYLFFSDYTDKQIWIKTVDKFIPWEAKANGTIIYKSNEGSYIPTDGCYIRVYGLTPTSTRHVLYTSSGLHTVGLTKWEMTAAVRERFNVEKDVRYGQRFEDRYREMLERLVNRKKPTVRHTRLAHLLFNPLAETYGHFDRSVKTVFPEIKKDDRTKILQSEVFRRAVMETIKSLLPELPKKFREELDAKTMVDWATRMFDKAEKQGTVDDMMKVFEKTVEVGHTEQVTVNDLTQPGGQHRLEEGKQDDTDLYSEGAAPDDSVPETTQDQMDREKQKKEEGDEMSEDELKQARKDNDVVKGFVQGTDDDGEILELPDFNESLVNDDEDEED